MPWLSIGIGGVCASIRPGVRADKFVGTNSRNPVDGISPNSTGWAKMVSLPTSVHIFAKR